MSGHGQNLCISRPQGVALKDFEAPYNAFTWFRLHRPSGEKVSREVKEWWILRESGREEWRLHR